uniref:Uncharacterized protein n=1 Tax=Lotus japonicus TaxID=34305 RepID=I3S529_LOTJA|nr:unknown [Lotus japonicus]
MTYTLTHAQWREGTKKTLIICDAQLSHIILFSLVHKLEKNLASHSPLHKLRRNPNHFSSHTQRTIPYKPLNS